MKFLHNHINRCFLVLIVLLAVLSGCSRKKVCTEELKKLPARVVSISGPEHVKTGEQVILTVGVLNARGWCVKEATAYVENIGLDTLLVTADLTYGIDPVFTGCECKTDSIIYTLLYFTPLNDGTYRIITKPDSTATNVSPADIVDFTINSD